MIPSIIEKEKETLKTELSLVDGCSVIFDGSTRLGEALAIVVRFVDDEWNVQQRLIRLQVLAKDLIRMDDAVISPCDNFKGNLIALILK